MSYHIHIKDEAGLWSCSGPYKTEDDATRMVEDIVRRRQDGPWVKSKVVPRWNKKSNPEHYIEVIDK